MGTLAQRQVVIYLMRRDRIIEDQTIFLIRLTLTTNG
jgi:hypothetical protein